MNAYSEFIDTWNQHYANGQDAFCNGLHRELPEEQGRHALAPAFIRAWQLGWDHAYHAAITAEYPF